MLSFERYRALGGSAEQADFARFEAKSARLLARATPGRLRQDAPPSESVERCMAELIDMLREESEYGDRSVTSVQNGDLRVSYAARGGDAPYGEVRAVAIIRAWLLGERDAYGVPLLYAGNE